MSDFAGLRVAGFESRRTADMERMIAKFKGDARVSPSMREVPLAENRDAIDFANRLITGQIDVVVLLTGVGLRHLVAAIEKHVDREQFLSALSDVITIARGPKPVAVMKEYGLAPTHRVPEPNTWRELLRTIDAHVSVANMSVGLQEYGQPNPSLVAGLEARGARVICIKVYNWELPLDCGPLENNVRELAAGQIDVALFTSAHQVVNMLRVADDLGLKKQLAQAMRGVVVASIGPTTSERLRQCELPIDMEPSHPKMGTLIAEAAAQSAGLRERKQKLHLVLREQPMEDRGDVTEAAWYNSPFMKACRLEPTDVTPVWLMRQAGRYMKEYREVRAKTTFLELCKNPSLCAEVAITALNRLNVDAAIIFSDLLPILEPMGMDLEFAKGEGPVIHNPIRDAPDIDRVLELTNVDSLHYVMETCQITRAEMPAAIPLLGFAGAPFTLASYAIEGGGSRNYVFTKTLMYRDQGAWDELMQRLVRSIALYLNAQIAAGVQAVQIFDSWVGCLSPDDYRRYVLPHSKALIEQIVPGTPVIHFATGNPALLPALSEAGGHVIGLDWRMRLDDAWRTVGYEYGVMGNLDPLTLLATPEEIRRQAKHVLDQAAGRPGHVFNLGHGVIPQVNVDHAIALVDAVHELSAR